MSKRAQIRNILEGMEVDLQIPHDVTLTDEDRLIVVVGQQQKIIQGLQSHLNIEVSVSAPFD